VQRKWIATLTVVASIVAVGGVCGTLSGVGMVP
jgi:hypothetical protein